MGSRLLIQSFGIRLEQSCHLVDKRTGTTGTNTVHPFLKTSGEIDDFGILSPQLYGNIRLRRNLLQGRGHSYHFLQKRNMQGMAQINCTGTGNPGA